MKPSNVLILVGTVERYSDRNDEYYYDVDLIDGDTGAYYHTYVSDNNRNSRMWMQAIEMFHADRSKGIVISGDFRLAKNKHTLVDADVKFEYLERVDRFSVLQAIM